MKPGIISNVNENDMFRMGPKEEVYLPSGFAVTIRERNGDDEDVLSKVKDNKDSSAINNFLAAIIVDPVMTAKNISELRIKDKYFILFRSRIQSLGNIVVFRHTFTGDKERSVELTLEEDLLKYNWDFSKPYEEFPFKPNTNLKPGEIDPYFKYRCKPYPKDSKDKDGFDFTLASGKNCRMKYMTGEGEIKSLKKDMGELTINDKLRVRDFELQMNNSAWTQIERFNMLTGRDMMEIRNKLEELDNSFDLTTEAINPLTGQVEYISLFLKEDFFFPLSQ